MLATRAIGEGGIKKENRTKRVGWSMVGGGNEKVSKRKAGIKGDIIRGRGVGIVELEG